LRKSSGRNWQIADQLVNSDPANAQYRYSRGVTNEQLWNFSGALTDYIAALQLMGTPNDIDGGQFYDIARMYAALGRYCDAIAPIETFISFDPAERRTPQTTKIISEYAKKGTFDAHYARGVGKVPLLNATGVRTLAVIVNGMAGKCAARPISMKQVWRLYLCQKSATEMELSQTLFECAASG
jgi:tetratricopeptide (TPR) repeat protein